MNLKPNKTVIDDKDPEFQERKEHFKNELLPFKQRLSEWEKHHPNEPPPIHVDDEGQVHWLNRKMRRKFQK